MRSIDNKRTGEHLTTLCGVLPLGFVAETTALAGAVVVLGRSTGM